MRVLVSDALDPAAVARVRAAGHEVVERPGLNGPELAQALEGFDALWIRSGTRATAEVLRETRTLRLLVRAGTGLDNVDVAAAAERGIEVANTPGANRVAVAELVFGLLLEFERHIGPASAALGAGRWEKSRFAGRELAGRTLGLIGFGRIAREVAVRARAFDLSVIACDPLLSQWPAGFEWAARGTLDQVLSGSDVVSVHVPLESGTRGLIGARELALMKTTALLVNAARGGIVDEAALADALTGGRLRGALLDVFEHEPPGELALLQLPNVIATPHLGASTAEAQARAGDEAADILIERLAALANAR